MKKEKLKQKNKPVSNDDRKHWSKYIFETKGAIFKTIGQYELLVRKLERQLRKEQRRRRTAEAAFEHLKWNDH